MTKKRAGPSPTLIPVLAKQRNRAIPRGVRYDQVVCQPNAPTVFDQSSVKLRILVEHSIIAPKLAKPLQIKQCVVTVFYPATPVKKPVGRAPRAEERVLRCSCGALKAALAAGEHGRDDGACSRFDRLRY